MDNNFVILVTKKMIQKELLNELYNKGLIDFVNTNNVVKKLDSDIYKLNELQKKDKDAKNIIVNIPL